jgi:hypothetical protein
MLYNRLWRDRARLTTPLRSESPNLRRATMQRRRFVAFRPASTSLSDMLARPPVRRRIDSVLSGDCYGRLVAREILETGMSSVSTESRSLVDEPFRIGPAMSRAFDVFVGNFGKFLLLALVTMSPVLALKIFGAAAMVGGLRSGDPTAISMVGATGFFGFLLQIVAQGACLYGSYRAMRGESFTVQQSLGVAFRRFFPIIGVAILGGVLGLLGLMLLIVPGLIAAAMFYVAIPACVIENLGVTASLGRSRALTAGYRWQIFGVFVIVLIAAMIVGGAAGFLGAMVKLHVVTQVLQFVVNAVITAFGAVLVAVVYHDLRVAKEGVDIEKVTSVFD